MSRKFTDKKEATKENCSETVLVAPFPPENSMFFQIFFLTQDEGKNVEVLETNMIDFEEILDRLRGGESVFIKYKNQETFESHPIADDEEDNSWYFNRC